MIVSSVDFSTACRRSFTTNERYQSRNGASCASVSYLLSYHLGEACNAPMVMRKGTLAERETQILSENTTRLRQICIKQNSQHSHSTQCREVHTNKASAPKIKICMRTDMTNSIFAVRPATPGVFSRHHPRAQVANSGLASSLAGCRSVTEYIRMIRLTMYIEAAMSQTNPSVAFARR